MSLPDVVEGDPHVVAHNAERQAFNLLGNRLSRSPSFQPVRPVRKMISALQAGHGFTLTGGDASSNLNDTVDPGLGTQSATIVTDSVGTVAKFKSPVLNPTVDVSNSSWALLFRVENVDDLATFRLYFGDSSLTNSRNLNMIPTETGGNLAEYIKENRYMWWTCPPINGSDTGTGPTLNSIQTVQLSVSSVSGAQVTVHVAAFATMLNQPAFPNGAISITCDDGRASALEKGRAKMDQYGIAATSYVIADRIGLGGTYASWADLYAARYQSGWEMAAHSLDMASHNLGFSSDQITPDALQTNLIGNRQALYDQNLGVAEGFAFPRGISDQMSEDTAAKIVAYGRGVYTASNNNVETLPPANIMRLRAYEVGSTVTQTQLQNLVDKQVTQGKGWMIFTFHEIRDVLLNDGAPEVLTSTFNWFIDYIAGLSSKPAILPVMEVLKRLE